MYQGGSSDKATDRTEAGLWLGARLACTVRSVDSTVFAGPVSVVNLPLIDGQAQILPGHTDAFIALGRGPLTIIGVDKQTHSVDVNGGSCWVKDDRVKIIY